MRGHIAGVQAKLELFNQRLFTHIAMPIVQILYLLKLHLLTNMQGIFFGALQNLRIQIP